MKVVFLDFDGVINRMELDSNGHLVTKYPADGIVNNEQAIRFLNALCKMVDAKIVVSSSWKDCCDTKAVLYNSGLDHNIEVLGSTPKMDKRSEEIKAYLDTHPEIESYVVLDDDAVDIDYLVRCNPALGFNIEEFKQALQILCTTTWAKLLLLLF